MIKRKIKPLLINCLHSHQLSIRELARISGNIVASFSAVTFGPLYYRHLESNKIRGLKYQVILKEKIVYLKYTGGLITLIIHATILPTIFMPPFNTMPNPAITIHTNVSLAVWEITNRISPSPGLWHKAELDHINVLELKGNRDR